MTLLLSLDGAGFLGSMAIFSIMLLFFGTALLLFICLWWKGRLDMDDEPARRMLDDNDKGWIDDKSRRR
ncbi:hypothetical protein [Estrella lausannensis]|uniref:Conserved putative membrane protein n=1 Tax=Estrella lausannensis TaxID=483423 RepID=A0A0H5DNU8_9BACT|nr:hypothetical protein [Estrella lausannensis]CRX37518.1 Conserved putative membrane protein [Estrella lausannensis]